VPLTTSNPFKWRHYCAYRKSHPGRSRPAQTDANHKFGPRFRQASRTTRNQRRRLASRKEIWSCCAAGIGTPGVDRLLHRADDSHGLDVIFKEGLPGLRGWLWSACKVLAYARFADVDAQFEQFPMDARCTPERILEFSGITARVRSGIAPCPRLRRSPSAKLKPSFNRPILQVDDLKGLVANGGRTRIRRLLPFHYEFPKPQRRIRRIRRNLRPFIQNYLYKTSTGATWPKQFPHVAGTPHPSDR
jgi:hypothetical protein